MKIIDRYILQSLLLSYVICLVMVLCFYTIIDLFTNFEKFDNYRSSLIQYENAPSDIGILLLIAKYYIYHIPLIFYNLAPIATLMAGMFTLTRMSRSNELIPLKAGGISMYRLLLPFLTFGFIVACGMFLVQECIITEIADELETLQHMRYTTRWKINNIQYVDRSGQIFYITSYYPTKQTMEKIRVVIPYSPSLFRPKTILEAQVGNWVKQDKKQAVLLLAGTITEYDMYGQITNPSQPLPQEGLIITTDMSDLNLTHPDKKNLSALTIARIWESLERNPDLPSLSLTLHMRFSLPLSNILLIFLGLPLVLRRETRNFFVGAGVCAILSGVFYGSNLVCANLGFKEVLTPIFAAWFPMTAYGSCAIALWQGIHT